MKELEEEIKGLEIEDKRLGLEEQVTTRRNELRGKIWQHKVGRAKSVLKGIYKGGKALQAAITPAYSKENEEKVRRMRKNLGI